MFFQASLGIQLALLGISFLGTIVARDVGGIERADYANHTPAPHLIREALPDVARDILHHA